MIIVRTTLNTLPEKQKEVMQTLLSMMEPPANRNGLLSYGIYRDIEDNNIFNLISEWKSRTYLNLHLRSDTFSVLLGIKGLLLKPIEIQIIKVSSVEGLDAVEAARCR
ncbi:putative quinol monooxygenase [Desulfosediminicola flagellatus]|uniref:putative quinol monooxygenase n=1 Tax=Desulfosediminicola flagellatus TaxID=2569541 RepID=UPI0010AC8F67|nr:antibiotic biosynthesis monooxygenase family protein [Desulfosediminicola flagellatus]